MVERSPSNILHPLVLFACFVVVVAGMKAASSIIVPFLLALFIAVICSPPLTWLKQHRVPTWLVFIIILLVLMVGGAIIVLIIGSSLTSFSEKLPAYQGMFTAKLSSLIIWLQEHRLAISDDLVKEYINPGAVMQMVAQLMTGLSGVLTNAVMILIAVLFILIEATAFPLKIRKAVSQSDEVLDGVDDMISTINNYLAIKTLFSLLTGIFIALLLWLLGVDFPLLWGLLAFMLNFIPNIGSIIAAIPPILLALIQLGWWHAAIATVGFLAINFIFSNIFEPRMMGRRLGLSMLVIFVSLIFWGWVLGPVGMFLSVPLTMVFKLAMEHNDQTRWISILIGSSTA
jgi:predicted PurR-regulated permease PerM